MTTHDVRSRQTFEDPFHIRDGVWQILVTIFSMFYSHIFANDYQQPLTFDNLSVFLAHIIVHYGEILIVPFVAYLKCATIEYKSRVYLESSDIISKLPQLETLPTMDDQETYPKIFFLFMI